jgi:hypothetical protein
MAPESTADWTPSGLHVSSTTGNPGRASRAHRANSTPEFHKNISYYRVANFSGVHVAQRLGAAGCRANAVAHVNEKKASSSTTTVLTGSKLLC